LKNAARLLVDKLPKLKTSFAKLSSKDVLVGVPREDATRNDDSHNREEMNNATLAYIHDNGSPAQNIPARPFMKPGVENAKDGIVSNFKNAAKKAMEADDEAIERSLNKAGLLTASSMKSVINAGIAPALKYSTLLGRIRNRTSVKGAKAEIAARNAGEVAGLTNAKPLIATGQMRNSITYVLRNK
jgi:hypothetical protein